VARTKLPGFHLPSGAISNPRGYYYGLYSDSELAKHAHQTHLARIDWLLIVELTHSKAFLHVLSGEDRFDAFLIRTTRGRCQPAIVAAENQKQTLHPERIS
jgi:hypothetical protein